MGAFRSWWGVLMLAGLSLGVLGGCSNTNTSFTPTPTISAIVPSNATAGSESLTLFITGTGFIEGSQGASFGYWNNSPRSTILNTTTSQLQVTIPASDLVNPGVFEVSVSNPPPGGGPSSAIFFTVEAAQNGGPTISSFSPSSTAAGGQAFTLTVNGANFVANDVVTWNSQFRNTSFVNATQLTASITNTDIGSSGFAGVSVVNSANALIASPVVDFSVTGGNNPTPNSSSLTPATISVPNGVSGLQVFVNGSNFVPTSTVQWNGSPRATSYVSGSEVIAVILPADLASAGSASVSVTNPPPGGGVSGNLNFTVTTQ